jgi:phosphoglycolate phosphatase
MNDPAGDAQIEIINPAYVRGAFRCAVFDFDGTLSLLRGNWQGLMVPMMVEALVATGTSESRAELTAIVEEFVTRLTGQPTMQQMYALCDEIEKRGRPRPDANVYFHRYMDMLISRTEARVGDLEAGRAGPDDFLVSGSRQVLEKLKSAGYLLVISSGTNLAHVRRESKILKIEDYFAERIFAPVNDNPSFTKERSLRQLMADHGLRGDEIVSIGDGPAEMLAIKSVGGLAIGVASDEVHKDGRINQLKREHLIRSGADLIIPEYRNLSAVLKAMNVATL